MSDAEKFTNSPKQILNIVAVGAHPDDPETGCGGTLAKLAQQGHNVSILYLTRGEAGIKGVPAEEAGQIRSAESASACEMLGAKAFFMGQLDADTEINLQRYKVFHERLSEFEPDIVFTHWPLDTHIDHRTAAMLAYQSWLWAEEKFTLAYYEVMTGIQSHHFTPDVFIDITDTRDLKWKAIYRHVSQNPPRFHPYHDRLEEMRGADGGAAYAEGFVVVREKWPKSFAI